MALELYLEIALLAFTALLELNTQILQQEMQMEVCAPLVSSALKEHQPNHHAQQESIVCMKEIIKRLPTVMMDIDALVVTLYQIHILQKCLEDFVMLAITALEIQKQHAVQELTCLIKVLK
jgi:hypothetical protein